MGLFHSRPLRDALVFHLLFFAVTVPIAFNLRGFELSVALTVFAVAYNLLMPWVGLARRHEEWTALWLYLLPISITLPWADWMLVKQLHTLVFPGEGIPRIGGAVPIYFMGMWIMLLWPALWLASHSNRPYAVSFAVAFVGFIGWEWAAPALELWAPLNVQMVAGIALYVLIPEFLMVWAALLGWQQLRQQAPVFRVAYGVGVSVFYAGALALSHLWMEGPR